MIAFLLLLQLGSSPIGKPAWEFETYGKLIRVNLNQAEINPADTVGDWSDVEDMVGVSSLFYYGAVQTPKEKYLIYNWYRNFYQMSPFNKHFLKPIGSTKSWEMKEEMDFVSPFIYSLKTKVCKSGFWFISGEYHNTFLSNDDSVTQIGTWEDLPPNKLRIQNVAGEIEGKYLISTIAGSSTPNSPKVNYYLVDDKDFPFPDSSFTQFGDTDSTIMIDNLIQINSDLFLVYSGLMYKSIIVKKGENGFRFIKNAGAEFNQNCKLENNQIHVMEFNKLSQYTYNPADTTFSGPVVLATFPINQTRTDVNFKNIVFIENDTLKVFEVSQKEVTRSWSLKGYNQIYKPFIDGNDIYFHYVTKDQGVSVTDNAQKPDQFSVSVYPNPFNPSTTIKVNSSSPGVTTFSVVDLLGRQVLSLPDQNLIEGINEIPLNAGTLSSGLYFLKVTSGTKNQTVKLMLMK
ncbi:MAG: T9SS type A sorting domain-containing protein [Bacteroidetes bacterium]|nr:T9SS type A sorting domain-containing protein [Bacteroidota bacterium]